MAKQIVRLGILVLALLLFGACTQVGIEEVTPSLQPSNTSEITSTPPPRPTSTLTFTATARPTSTPIVADFRLLADLYWLRTNRGEIWRWQTDSSTAKCLAGVSSTCMISVPEPIIDFDYQNGKILVSLISTYNPKQGGNFQLGSIDISQQQYQTLVTEHRGAPQPDSPFDKFALSPNGTAAVYSLKLSDFESEVYFIDLDNFLEPTLIGRCRHQEDGGYCSVRILWAPDGQRVAYHAQDGLWLYEPGSDPELLIADNNDIEDAWNLKLYYPHTWSSDQQFLAFTERHWESSIDGVVEVTTKKTTYIPNTRSVRGDPEFNYLLTQENKIWLAQFTFGIEQLPEQIIIYNYSLHPNAGADWLIETSRRKMNFGIFDRVESIWEKPDGEILFLIWHNPKDSPPPYWLLAQYNVTLNEFSERNTINYDEDEWVLLRTVWLKDGSAVLLEIQNAAYYLTTDGNISESLTPFVGKDACCFQWVYEDLAP
ncbi:MAG: hypothetical protein JXB38_20450 [Anaerolineales bacterium]|nr:hypothetical protein [Anaerolineales bacterium]